jgi:hypothetical protein
MASRNLPEETTIDEPDIATQKLNELRERAKKDFSKSEIDDFIAMGKVLASKPVLSALIELINESPERGFDKKESDRLVKKISKLMPYKFAGHTSISFKEVPHILNLSLVIAPKDYKVITDIPHESYAADLYKQYDFLKNIAVAYWCQFSQDHSEVYKRVCDYRSDIDFSNLIVDPELPTTLYWDPESAKRVSLFSYYTLNGKPYYRK